MLSGKHMFFCVEQDVLTESKDTKVTVLCLCSLLLCAQCLPDPTTPPLPVDLPACPPRSPQVAI